MPTLLTEPTLKKAVEQQTFLKFGDIRSVDGIKVDLHLGDLVLKAQYGQPVSLKSRGQTESGALQIDPGEVVFVLTREEINFDTTMMATLSPKRGLAHSGIVILGGLAVDPGYRGVLWLGLYNISTTPFVLIEGRKLISAIFYRLTDEEANGVNPAVLEEPVRGFPDQLIELISKYRPVELKGLQDALDDTRRELTGLKRELHDDKSWRDDFKKSLDAHNSQIADLLKGLEAEVQARTTGEKEIKSQLSTISQMFSGLRSWRAVTIAALGLLAGAILTWVVPKLLDRPAPPTPVYIPYAYPPPGSSPPPATLNLPQRPAHP